MAEFFKKNREDDEKTNEWVNQFKPNFENAIERVEKHQERKLFTIEIIALVLFGAFLVNLLSSALFDLFTLLISAIQISRLILDVSVSSLSVLSLLVTFILFKKELKKYDPKKPVLLLWIKLQDIKPFSKENYYKAMEDFLYQGKLTNFKLFGDSFFKNLTELFSEMFGKNVNSNPINEKEEPIDSDKKYIHKEFVRMSKDYDLSNFGSSGVDFRLNISLIPEVVYAYETDENGVEHDKSAIYAFYLVYRFTIENPDHYRAREALEKYYFFYAGSVIRITQFPILNAFKVLGAFEEIDKAIYDKFHSKSSR